MKYVNAFKQVLAVIAALTCSSLLAQETSVPAAYVASPDVYQVLLENDEVLVLKMVLQPGQSDNWHKHNTETVYFEQGGHAQIKTAEDKVVTLDIPDGFVMWHEQWQHQVTNTGKTPITAIIVEKKAVKKDTK